MKIDIDFPGGSRVDAHFGQYTVKTDQPAHGGGQGSAPSPFDICLASIGACAGIYALNFCRQRNISTEGLHLVQDLEVDPDSGLVRTIYLDIQLPPNFPEKYRAAIVRATEQCTVKKHFGHPPSFEIRTHPAEMPAAEGR